MQQRHKTEWAVWAVCALTAAATLLALPALPEQIPMHWNIDGQIDGWAPRYGVFLIPLLQLAECVMLRFLPALDPKRKNYERFGGAYRALRLALALFMGLMQGVVLSAVLAPGRLNVARVVPACAAVLLCVIGNYMPKFRHNYFCGIRTPWTLDDAGCWRRTHRLAGPLWFWGGLLLAAASFLLPPRPLALVFFAGVLLLALIPVAASYLFYKKNRESGGSD